MKLYQCPECGIFTHSDKEVLPCIECGTLMKEVIHMNKRDLQRERNNNPRQLEHSSKIHRNCIRINTGNTYAHELKKFEECWRLATEGKEYITEAVVEGTKRRYDILVLDTGEIIEIETDPKIISEKRKGENVTYLRPSKNIHP